MEFKFKKQVDVDTRKKQNKELLKRNPKKIPIILEKDPKCKLVAIQKTKYLIQEEFSASQFIKMVKSLLNISEFEALFLTVKGKYSITGQKSMSQIYKDFKDKEDGFLYIAYTTELVYG